MMLKKSLWIAGLLFCGSVYCSSDINNPTPVYVVQGEEAVLQCGFESNRLTWIVYNGGNVNTIASAFDINDKSKYKVSTNPSTGLYYRLHILNVGMSDIKKYRCSRLVNAVDQHFYLMLELLVKPLIPSITVNKVSIEETKPLDVTCTTTGSRPKATLYWTIGQKDVTSDATEEFSHNTVSETYTVISDLTYSIGKSNNGQVLTCKAVNVAASSGVQANTTLDVKYAPTVTVSDATFKQNEAIRTLTCVPDGNPQSYSFYKWQHKSKCGVLIRELDREANGVLTLPNMPVKDRYQDSGEYVCTAGNSIVGRDGKIKQTGSGCITINGPPQTPTNFTIVSFTDTSIVVEWIPGYDGGHEQTFNIQYRIVNESKIWFPQKIPQYNRQTYTLSGLQGDTGYELRMFAENKIDRSLVTDIQLISTMPSVVKEPQDLNGLDGGVIGGLVGDVIISLVIILGILFFMRKKGLLDGRDKIKSNRNNVTAADNPTNNDTYEYIEGTTSNQTKKDPRNKRVETPSTKTYEVLGMTDTPNTYADLSSRREPTQSLPSTEHYEVLGQQDKPNVYECIKNKNESEDKEYINLKF